MNITSYLNTFTLSQQKQLLDLEPFYKEWNEKINLISRKDMDEFMLHHVLHSVSLTKFMKFVPGTEILDVGTGGGFPGIPLAIVYPQVQFHLIDGTGKKIKVVQAAIDHFQLANVKAEQVRIEHLSTQYDYIMARAVTNMGDLISMTQKHIKSKQLNARPNGLIAYKGFPLGDESKAVKKRGHEIFKITEFAKEEYFESKCIVYVPMY